MDFSFGGVFDTIGNNIGKIGTAVAGGFGAWASIKSRKQDIALQQAQVQAEIARIKAQKDAAIAAAQAQTTPVVAVARSGGFSLAGIPPWMIAAGALGGFFLLRGAVK